MNNTKSKRPGFGLSVGILASFLWSGVCLTLASARATGQTAAVQAPTGSIRVLVDPRVELMCIVFRLAGSPEYTQGAIPSYTKDVDAYFAPFKNHAVVVRAHTLRQSRGISYNAPMSLAVHVTGPPELAERVPLDPLPSGVDVRWTPAAAHAFLADLRSFAHETKFDAFLAAHQSLYETAAGRLRQVIREARVVEWFDSFFGRRAATDFVIPLGMLNGGGSYGVNARLDGRPPGLEIYSILGIWSLDDQGLPKFDKRIAGTIVHEFCHSYTNPLVDAHIEALRPAGEKLFPMVESDMRRQAYGTWQTLMYESLDRACGVRYTLVALGPEAAAREVAYNRDRRFLWTGRLSDLLGEYEKDRAAYPTLEAFFPKIVALFNDYIASGQAAADHKVLLEEKRAKIEALAAKAPKIVSMVPPNGAEDVDAALVKEIRITFGRPLRADRMALMTLEGEEYPGQSMASEKRPHYDAMRTVLVMPCELKPGTSYGFSINSEDMLVMADDAGNPVMPLVYRFRTKK